MVPYRSNFTVIGTTSGFASFLPALIILCLLNLNLTLAAQSPVIDNIPSEEIDEGQMFASISLDDYVNDPDDADDVLEWSYSNNDELSVSITDRVALVTVPDENWNGSETITFTVTDPDLNTVSDDAVFTVLPVNDAPVVTGIPDQSVDEGVSLDPVSLNNYVTDIDNDVSELTWSVSGDNNLTVVIDGDDIATITPDAGWTGVETLVFAAADPGSLTGDDDAAFTIKEINAPPTDITLSPTSVNENAASGTEVGTLTTTDPDAEVTFTYTLVSGAGSDDNSSFSISGDKLVTAGVFDFETKAAYTVRVRSTDGSAGFIEEAFAIAVNDVNEAPVAVNNAYTFNEGSNNNITAPGVLAGDSDPDGNPLTAVLVSSPSYSSSFILNPNGSFTYNHNGSEITTDAFTYRASDGTLPSNIATVNITLTPVNDAPVITGQNPLSVLENQSLLLAVTNLIITDPDDIPAGMTLTVQNGANYTVSGTTITPASGFNGDLTVPVYVNDGDVNSNTFNLTVTVTGVNDPPVITGQVPLNVNEDQSLTLVVGNFTITDIDNPSGPFTLTVQNGSNYNHSGNTITPVLNYNGPLTVPVTVSDPVGAVSGVFNASVTVNPVNDTPVVSDIPNETIAEGQSFSTISLDNYVTDVDNTDNQITWTFTGNSQLTVTITNRIATITPPNSDWNGAETITFIATDPGLLFTSNQATFTVTGTNDPPVADNVVITPADPRIGVTNTGTFTYSDPDGDPAGTHLYKWYRATTMAGTDAVAIAGATAITYRPVKADGARYICFEVTPVDQPGLPGVPVKSPFKYINNSPAATNVQINAPGTEPGQTISAVFTYSDTEGNPQDAPNNIYRWYRKTTAAFTPASPGTLIGSESTYRLRSQDANMYIWYRVSPAAQSGSTPGDSVWSNIIGPIGTFSANISGTASFCPGATMPITLSITGGVAPYTAVLTRTGSTSNKDTTIAAIPSSPYTINVKIPGTYVLTSLTDAGEDPATSSATSVVLQFFAKVKAVLTGSAEICNDGISTATLNLNFSAGTAPWTFVASRLRSNGTLISDTTFTNVNTDPYVFPGRVFPTYNTTLYRIKSLTDVNGCPGDTAGTGTARITYKVSPTAVISGIDSICPDETANLQVVLTGTGPFSITYLRNGANPTVINGINGLNYTLQVTQTGTYTLSRVQDALCTGKTSGTGIVRSHSFPTAILSGTTTICEHTSANLTVALTGAAPWKFSYRRNTDTPIEVPNVLASPRTVAVQQAGTYILTEVYDKNCKGTVSGSAVITVTEAPEVELNGLGPAYNKQSSEWVLMTGTPSGGTYSGPGVIPYNSSWYFVPSLPPVGTHNIVYAYRASPSSCYGYDTSVVRILEASAVIEFENNRTKYCRNDHSFVVTGVNLANVIGTFTINGGIGLVDHHDNTATVYPAQLAAGEYTITYTYYDGTSLSVNSKFDVGLAPVADFKWETECFQAGKAISLTNTSASNFGNLTDTSYYWKIYTPTGFLPFETKDITYTFAQAGNQRIDLEIQNTYGCADTVSKIFSLRPTYSLKDLTYTEDFADNPLEWQSGTSTTVTVNSWRLGNPTKGFTGDHCWFTYIPGTSAPREQSWITSPCFDFTGTQRPMLKMDIWRLFNLDRDGATVQYSVDSSKTWNVLGELSDGLFWYNDYQIDGKPGDQSLGWSNYNSQGNDTEWKTARHSLDILKSKKSVQFRIAYGSDGTARNNNGFAFDNFWIGERNRTALLEHFTNSSDQDCDSVDAVLNNLVNNNGINIIDLQYHTSFPGADLFNQHNPTIPGARVFYYGFSDVPYTILNGGSKTAHRFDHTILPLTPNAALVESLYDSKFWITLNSKVSGDILNVEAQVFALQDIPATQLTVHIAVIEKVITGVTGSNGETSFESVVKTMLPDAAGTTIYQAWKKDEPRYVNESWQLQHVYDTNQLRIVAFVQDESTFEIYQAAMDTIGVFTGLNDHLPGAGNEKPFVVYPNPAGSMAFVEFEQDVTEDITFEMYNTLGNLVFVKHIPAGTQRTEIPVENYPNGLYILRLVSRDQLIGISKLTISK
ncbi:MAG: tandem-95 repeat protein [Bacteroidales bacterium]|nr:tandem-95 repeat protein [Bacteroidales bacterium]